MRVARAALRTLAVCVARASCAVTACSGPVDPSTELTGRWATRAESLDPAGSYRTFLTFAEDGRFAIETRLYDLYPGRVVGEASAYSRIAGTFDTRGERLVIATDSLIWWDGFSGPDTRDTLRTHYPDPVAILPDVDTRYEVRGDVLVLRYLTDPADALEPVTVVYGRQR